MEKQLSISQVREELGTLVDEVQYENSKYIICLLYTSTTASMPITSRRCAPRWATSPSTT